MAKQIYREAPDGTRQPSNECKWWLDTPEKFRDPCQLPVMYKYADAEEVERINSGRNPADGSMPPLYEAPENPLFSPEKFSESERSISAQEARISELESQAKTQFGETPSPNISDLRDELAALRNTFTPFLQSASGASTVKAVASAAGSSLEASRVTAGSVLKIEELSLKSGTGVKENA